ncbi:hypothetical protein LXL04_024328 [Taraxacum kok-saghyz]
MKFNMNSTGSQHQEKTGDLCIADSASTHTILKSKKYFSELVPRKAVIHNISGPADLVEGSGKAQFALPNGTSLYIKNALFSPKSSKNLLSFNDIYFNGYDAQTKTIENKKYIQAQCAGETTNTCRKPSNFFILFISTPEVSFMLSRSLFFFPSFNKTPNKRKQSPSLSSSSPSPSVSRTTVSVSPTTTSPLIIRLTCSGATFTLRVRNATSSSHCFLACASSDVRDCFSFFNFSFSSDKFSSFSTVGRTTEPGFFEFGDEVELEWSSSPELEGGEAKPPSPSDFPFVTVTVFRRWISMRSSFRPRLKYSLANSHLSGRDYVIVSTLNFLHVMTPQLLSIKLTNKAGEIVVFEGIRKQIPSEISSFPNHKSVAGIVPRNHLIRHRIIHQRNQSETKEQKSGEEFPAPTIKTRKEQSRTSQIGNRNIAGVDDGGNQTTEVLPEANALRGQEWKNIYVGYKIEKPDQ